jgi:transposase
MMGRDKPPQRSLFYTGINLEKRVRHGHVLRKVAKLVDFEFVYGEVKEHYGYNGNVSVAPPVILKLMMLLVLYNVRSERELMATLPERLDWLWFLGLDLDSDSAEKPLGFFSSFRFVVLADEPEFVTRIDFPLHNFPRLNIDGGRQREG